MKLNRIFVSVFATTFSMFCFADESLSPKQKEYFNWIISKSGETKAMINSRDRKPEKQVSIMWTNCVAKSKGEKCKKENLALGYNSTCSSFMLNAFNSNADAGTNKKNMSKALAIGLKSLGNNRPCMQHVVVPGIERLNRAIDVKALSVKNHVAFYEAVMHKDSCADKTRFFYPDIPGKPKSRTPDKAFHLEFRLDDSCPN